MKYLAQNIPSGKRVLVRVDYNVPIENDKITDDTRIKQSLPTLNSLLDNLNRVIILSHLGRPEGKDPSLSLEPVRERLQELLPNKKILLVKDFTQDKNLIENQKLDEIILLENIRFFPGEKNSDQDFTKALSALGDVYVNDGFSVSHRRSASTTGLPTLLPSFAGLSLEKELDFLTKLKNPERPFIAIIGGGKISTKLTLLDSLAKKVDKILIGGALANNLLKAKGLEIGQSKYEPDLMSDTQKLLASSPHKFVLPIDAKVENAQGQVLNKDATNIAPQDQIKDIGDKTIEEFANFIKDAQIIVWNGPLGMFEDKRFAHGTEEVLKAVAESSGTTILGGGDTIAAVSSHPELAKKISFISTGGGALLEYLEKGSLPAVDALEQKPLL